MKEQLDARKVAADASSERRAQLSAISGNSANNMGHHGRARSRMAGIPEGERGAHLIQDLDMSFISVDSRGHITPKTPEAAYMTAHTYIMATMPAPGDPRASLYQTAMAGIGIMGAAIASRECERSPRCQSPWQGEAVRRRSRSLRAAHTYMMATMPAPRDPRASLYQTAMAGIGLMGAAIANKGTV